jgi:hypothetical protein
MRRQKIASGILSIAMLTLASPVLPGFVQQAHANHCPPGTVHVLVLAGSTINGLPALLPTEVCLTIGQNIVGSEATGNCPVGTTLAVQGGVIVGTTLDAGILVCVSLGPPIVINPLPISNIEPMPPGGPPDDGSAVLGLAPLVALGLVGMAFLGVVRRRVARATPYGSDPPNRSTQR